MELKASQTESYGLVELIGQFWEHKDFQVFEEAIAGFVAAGLKTAVLDMSRLSFISSQGLGRLVRAYSHMNRAGGGVVLLCPVGSVRETIEIAGFAEFLKICTSSDELDAHLKGLPS